MIVKPHYVRHIGYWVEVRVQPLAMRVNASKSLIKGRWIVVTELFELRRILANEGKVYIDRLIRRMEADMKRGAL